MLRPKTLIHMLVSLALILNGIGAAAASTVMAWAQADTVASVAPKGEKQVDSKQAAMQSGCHEHETIDPHPRAAQGDSTDCCKDGGCGCGCAHQSQVVLAAEFLVMPAIAPVSMPLAELASPLSPSLSRPVRPPIA